MAGNTDFMTHLGDGAYVEVEKDGGIWLAANDHNNRVLYLEPGALEKLVEFHKYKMVQHKANK